MPSDFDYDRVVELKRVVERVVDPLTGEETMTETLHESVERFDGSMEMRELTEMPLLPCKHPHRPGGQVAVCETCSKRAKKTVWVCGECARTCPLSGKSLCVRCAEVGPDGRHYLPKALRKAMRRGFFRTGPAASPLEIISEDPAPRRGPGPSFFRRFLEWW